MNNTSRKNQLKRLAVKGYKKLAFGDTSDALRLIINTDISNEQLSKMDFYNISEIKKTKDNCIEIKFFDRLKALQMIEDLSQLENDDILPFYKALENTSSEIDR